MKFLQLSYRSLLPFYAPTAPHKSEPFFFPWADISALFVLFLLLEGVKNGKEKNSLPPQTDTFVEMLAHLKRAPFLSSTLFHLPPTHFPQGAFSLFRSLVAKKNLRASYITVMTAEIGSIHIHSVSVTIKFIHIINKFSALVLSLSLRFEGCGERGKSRKEFSLPYRKKEFGMKK